MLDASDRAPPRNRSAVRRGELVVVFLAALLFGTALWWPLATLDRSAPAAEDALFEPPPSWLLPLDDAYIFVRYARQAARGHPLEWNEGEVSTGASSFVFPWLLVPGVWLFDGVAGWSRWSSFVGLLSLWTLGVAGLRCLRAAGVPDPWPLAAALALVWCGPIGWAAIAGMDSALGAAALLWAAGSWTLACRPGSPAGFRAHLGLLALIGALPLFRPDFAVVAGLAAVALGLRLGPPAPRWCAALVLVPGLLMGAMNWTWTGHFSPAGALAKSTLSAPFLSLESAAILYQQMLVYGLLPVYAGLREHLLPPPVGWLAAAMTLTVLFHAARRKAMRSELLAPLALLWLALVAVAPLSGFLIWQHLRHHHPGLACAWLLTAAALARSAQALRRRGLFTGFRFGRFAVLALPCLLWLRFPYWSRDYFAQAVRFYQNNGKAAEWLAAHPSDGVLLLHDAGLLALAHDGPAVDVIGLGTTEFAPAYRNGLGAVVETLARRPELPRRAAVWDRLFQVPELLGPPLFEARKRPDLPEDERLRVSPFRAERLDRTALAGPGIDLAYLPDERRLRPEWSEPPPGGKLSLARTLLGPGGELETQGCRPLPGRLSVELPENVVRVRLRAAPEPGSAGRLRVGFEGEGRFDEVVMSKDPRHWTQTEKTVEGRRLFVENAGPGAPCLESVAFVEP